MTLDCEAEHATKRKYDGDGNPELPTVHVPFVEKAIEKPYSEVVHDCRDPATPDGIVRPDVGHDIDFACQRHGTANEATK